MVEWMHKEITASETLEFKKLESHRGFLVSRWVPCMREDVDALHKFFSTKTPPKRIVRPLKGATAVYAFGDASSTGLGSSITIGDAIHYQIGQWDDEVTAESSNYRELANLVNSLELAHSQGLLKNTEVFMFTDNSTAEATVLKGTSKSRKLFDLILRLHMLHMHGDMIIHFVHVSGRRMIAQGTDGLSRGNTHEGVFSGHSFLSSCPLHLSTLE